MLFRHTPLKRQPFPIRRPMRIARHIIFASDQVRFLRGQIHEPKLRRGPPRPVVENHRVGNVTAVWRKNRVADKAKTGEITALEALRAAEGSQNQEACERQELDAGAEKDGLRAWMHGYSPCELFGCRI